jgi:hypothetical protein
MEPDDPVVSKGNEILAAASTVLAIGVQLYRLLAPLLTKKKKTDV